jgi:HAE1 family hydrophobic/amphiphilic exporter-1
MNLTRASMRRPVTLAMALASITILGFISFAKLPLAFLPQVEFPFIGVWVPYPGGGPSEIEREIARPIEEILATLGGVRKIESRSDEGEAWIDVEFEWGRDVNVLRMEVQEKIDQIRGDLPRDIRKILLLTFNSNDIPVIEGRISAKGRDLSESYDLIEQKIIMPLQQIPGVGRVGIDGVNPTVGEIYLRLDKIQEFGVDVGKLFDELAAANVDLSVGEVTDRGLRYHVRTVSGIESMRELGEIPIDERGLRLADVAQLTYAAPVPEYGRHLNGEFAIAFWIQKASGFNTVDVCRAVEAQLAEINLDPALRGIDCFTFFDQAEQIENALRGLWNAGLSGAVLAAAVLFLFLRKVGVTILVCLSIPLSILATGTFLYLGGGNLNILTMMGLMLGTGMLVDNAVVVVESINRRRNLGASPVSAALRGTRDVGTAIVASTLTTVIVFAPIIVGRADEMTVWLGQVGITIGVTILCSLLVSLTVIPTLSVFLSRGRSPSDEPRWIDAMRRRYLRIVDWTTLRHPWRTGLALVPAVVLLTGGLAKLTGAFNAEFMGEKGLRQERLRIRFEYQGDVQVDKNTSKQYVMRVEEYLETRREELGLRDVYSYYAPGSAGMSLFFERGELSQSFLEDVREDLRKNLPVQAGLEYEFGDEEGNDAGGKGFTITLFGEDTELLSALAAEAERRLEALEDISDVGSAEQSRKEILVAIDRDRASRRGVRAGTISQVLGLTYRGTPLPRLNTGEKEIDLSISLLPDDAESIENLYATTVSIEDGAPVTLDQVADFRFVEGPQQIWRENRKTGIAVRGSYDGDDLDKALERVAAVMNDMQLPLGYGWNFGREIREAREQQSELGMNMLLAMFCVFFVMAILFESLVHPAVVMGCVPFAFLGVVWLFMATGTPFNLMAGIGTVVLIGIVVNNGIVLVDHINHYRAVGRDRDDAILLGCAERLRPILMTAGTTILGLLPLAVFPGAHAGDAQYYPMARAIIGGLVASTLLTLIVMPTYYRLADTLVSRLRACLASAGAAAPVIGTDP